MMSLFLRLLLFQSRLDFVAPFAFEECTRRLDNLHDDEPTNTSVRYQQIIVEREQNQHLSECSFVVSMISTEFFKSSESIEGTLTRDDAFNTHVSIRLEHQWIYRVTLLMAPIPLTLIWFMEFQATLVEKYELCSLLSCLLIPTTLFTIIGIVSIIWQQQRLCLAVQASLGYGKRQHQKNIFGKPINARNIINILSPLSLQEVISRLQNLNQQLDHTKLVPITTVDVKQLDYGSAEFKMHRVVDPRYMIAAEIHGMLIKETEGTTIVEAFAYRPAKIRVVFQYFAVGILLAISGYVAFFDDDDGNFLLGFGVLIFLIFASVWIGIKEFEQKPILIKQLKNTLAADDVFNPSDRD